MGTCTESGFSVYFLLYHVCFSSCSEPFNLCSCMYMCMVYACVCVCVCVCVCLRLHVCLPCLANKLQHSRITSTHVHSTAYTIHNSYIAIATGLGCHVTLLYTHDFISPPLCSGIDHIKLNIDYVNVYVV